MMLIIDPTIDLFFIWMDHCENTIFIFTMRNEVNLLKIISIYFSIGDFKRNQ